MPATRQDPGACNCAPDALECSPCPIPKANLHISGSLTGFGNVLAFEVVSLDWSLTQEGLLFQLSCVSGEAVFFVQDIEGDPIFYPLVDSTCDPFHLHFSDGFSDFYIDP